MILTSLAAYYERLLANGAVQPPGFQEKEIAWIVTIDRDGQVVGLSRTGDGKRGGKFKVPAEIKRSVNIAANLLWDNAEYVLGVARAGADGKQAAKVPLRHAAFMQRLTDLPESVKADEGVTAVRDLLPKFDDNAMTETWRMMAGDREVMAQPRAGFVRNVMFSHWYQHRGQFSVYLRLLNVAVPASWGPSADEAMAFEHKAEAAVAAK